MQETPNPKDFASAVRHPVPTVRIGATDKVKEASVDIVVRLATAGLALPEILSALSMASASIIYHAGAQHPGADGELLETFWRELRRAHAAHVTQGIQTTKNAFHIPPARMSFR